MLKLLAFLSKLFGFLKDRQLIKAGEDKERRKQAEKIVEDVENIKRAKRNADDSVFDDYFK